jgi:hypothetical protein
MDPACGITEAEFPATLIIAAASAELRAVESGKQAAPAGLAGYSCQRVLRGYRACCGVLAWIGYARAGAAIGIAHQHAAKLVDRDVIKVEQVAARIAAAAIPDAAALHRV